MTLLFPKKILKKVNYMPSNPYAVSDLKFAITPMINGIRCAGTTELGGLEAKPNYKRIDIRPRDTILNIS